MPIDYSKLDPNAPKDQRAFNIEVTDGQLNELWDSADEAKGVTFPQTWYAKGIWDTLEWIFGDSSEMPEVDFPVPVGSLKFDQLREANLKRLPLFKNGKGEPAHSKPDGSDWKLSGWACAVSGELGEACNLIKKIERGDFSLEDKKQDLADELADIQIYLDILAYRAGVDLGEATKAKFNRKSIELGIDVFIA